jgi:hypothetical protein
MLYCGSAWGWYLQDATQQTQKQNMSSSACNTTDTAAVRTAAGGRLQDAVLRLSLGVVFAGRNTTAAQQQQDEQQCLQSKQDKLSKPRA